MVQLQEGQLIQLATDGSLPEFPEGSAKDSQLLLSATFLTAELALLQNSLEVKLKDKRVSCHHTPPASAPRLPGSACLGHLGVVQESDAELLMEVWGCLGLQCQLALPITHSSAHVTFV